MVGGLYSGFETIRVSHHDYSFSITDRCEYKEIVLEADFQFPALSNDLPKSWCQSLETSCNAGLTRMSPFEQHERLQSLILIAVVENNEQTITAELKADLFEAIGTMFCDEAVDRAGACERNLLSCGCLQRASATLGVFLSDVVMTLKTPGANPACTARFARIKQVSGVSGEDFAISVHPAARAAAALRRIILQGKTEKAQEVNIRASPNRTLPGILLRPIGN